MLFDLLSIMVQATIELDFGCMQFSLFTVLAVDKHHNGTPVLHTFLGGGESTDNITAFLRPLAERIRARVPDWKPGCFMVDCSAAESSAIRSARLVCLLHVYQGLPADIHSLLTCALQSVFSRQALAAC